MMSHSRTSSVFALALLFTLVAAPKPSAAVFMTDPVVAQTTTPDSFPLPDSVPSGTTVQIDGSNSMATVNQALKQQFEEQYPDTSIELGYSGTATALQALINDDIDLAAIGRSLTDTEKAQGLTEVPIGRHKVAIIVGANNPFSGNITFEQFARIFRGEITDWAQLGGEPGPIRMVDHPEASDTRAALAQYPVFQSAPFETGATATQVNEDSVEAIVRELGTNGISYIVADQAFDRSDVKILPMHRTLPDDPRYPFSQPLVYVYKGEASPAVASFLGFAAAPVGQTAIESVGAIAQTDGIESPNAPNTSNTPDAASTATPPTNTASPDAANRSPDAGVSPDASVSSESTPAAGTGTASVIANPQQDPTWLWWLIPLLLSIPLLWWLFKGRRSTRIEGGRGSAASSSGDETLAERTGNIISADRTSIAATQSQPLSPPSDVSDIPSAATVEGDELAENTLTGDTLTGDALAGAALGVALGGAALAGVADAIPAHPNRIDLVPRTANQAYASWETAEQNQAALRQTGGRQYTLRICDVTGIDIDRQAPHSIQYYVCDETDRDRHVPIPQPDRDYIAEIGYQTDDGGWLLLARSASVRISSTATDTPSTDIPSSDIPSPATTLQSPSTQIQPEVSGATIAEDAWGDRVTSLDQEAVQEAVEATKFNVGQSDLRGEGLADVDANLPDLPSGYGESQIFLLPRDPHWAYAYWDIPSNHKEAVRRQGGTRLALRFYDVTHIDLATQNPHSLQQYDCDELARDWYIPVPLSDRDYIVEIGYLTQDGSWLMLARSLPTRIPPVYPAEWLEDQFVTVDWEEDLRGKSQFDLKQPAPNTFDTSLYDKIFSLAEAAETQRLAGSLFGSMQQVPEQAISSFAFPSGIGMSGVGMSSVGMMSGVGMSGVGMSGVGMSGVGMGWTMSGIGMSGIGMSGIGMSASIPPIRPRQFWLVADAELIVYGATEPDATLMIGDRIVKLNPDGTFRFQVAFPDGNISYPILAIAADGEQSRSIRMEFHRETPMRNTNTKDEAVPEWFRGEE